VSEIGPQWMLLGSPASNVVLLPSSALSLRGPEGETVQFTRSELDSEVGCRWRSGESSPRPRRTGSTAPRRSGKCSELPLDAGSAARRFTRVILTGASAVVGGGRFRRAEAPVVEVLWSPEPGPEPKRSIL
jgi:hypothetical protein